MLNDLQNWWQNRNPETDTYLLEAGVVLAAFFGGLFLGALVARALRARNFDAVLRPPGSSPTGTEGGHGFTPTYVAGLLVRLTVWARTAWWLAQRHGWVEFADALGLVMKRTWAVAALLVAALALGSLLAHRLIACFPSASKGAVEPSRNNTGASYRGAGGAVGAGAYVLAVLLVLLMATDWFGWPLTHNAALALWQFAEHLLVAAAALVIGAFGARWARDLVSGEAASSLEKRAGQFTALGIMAMATLLALAVALTGAGALIGLATLAVLALLLWLVRGYLPDVMAGLRLRADKVREVFLDGEPWQVTGVGLVNTELGKHGEFYRMQNRMVMRARQESVPVEAAAR
jgi:hypothetical protein